MEEEKTSEKSEEFQRSSRRTRAIATAAIYAAVYVALTLVFNPISYGQVQLRVANIMVGLVPFFGWAGVAGQALGVFVANVNSPLGPIDMLNALPSLVCSWAVWRLRGVSVVLGLLVYSFGVGLSVSLTLSYAFGLPLLVTLLYVITGNVIATTCLGYVFYRAVKRTGVMRLRQEK